MDGAGSWIVFGILILGMLSLDLFFHRKKHEAIVKEAIWWSVFWILLALLFNLHVYITHGKVAAINFFTGYLIEKSLSFDNLFVFLLIFEYFRTPSSSIHKVLFVGVLSAILMRGLFIWLGIGLIAHFEWMIYVFGGFLIFTGIKLWIDEGEKINPEKNPILWGFRALVPVSDTYEDNRFFVRKGSRWLATPLLVVLLAIETADVIFAVDSVPAVLSITSDPFIVYTSNIFAIFGLRSLYFLLDKFKSSVKYVHHAVSIILVFVGSKMLLSDIFNISNIASLIVIFLVLLGCVVASAIAQRNR